MKILLVHNVYQHPGGEDVVQRAEKALLLAQGHEVVEYLRDNSDIDVRSVGAKVGLAVRTVWAADSYHDLRSLIERERPEVAHFTNTFPLVSPSAYYACKQAGVAVVQSLHNYRLLCPAATFYRDGQVCEECVDFGLERSVRYACYHDSRAATAVLASMLAAHRILGTYQRMVDQYIALTEFARRKFVAGGLPAERISVKPNFMADDPQRRESSGEHAVFIGRLVPEKGLACLLAAWRTLGGVPLRVIGDGPERPALEALARGVDSITFVGRLSREQTLSELRRARLLMFPSEWYEGFPMTILEAFACAVPVVGTRLGGMAELIDDGRTGLLYAPGDARSLAERVRWAFENPEALEEMGQAARQEYERKFTAEHNYQLLLAIYERALKRNRASKSDRASDLHA